VERPHPWALAAFATSLAGGFFVGEVFPFSRFAMYADLAPRGEGFVPVFLADGVLTEPRRFERFSGIGPGDFAAPEGVASSLDYVVDERAAWVAGRIDTQGPGPVTVEVGYDLVHLEGGELVRDRHIVARGTAWAR
jgi:hypothetical protein